jgi:hypothetical protein
MVISFFGSGAGMTGFSGSIGRTGFFSSVLFSAGIQITNLIIRSNNGVKVFNRINQVKHPIS